MNLFRGFIDHLYKLDIVVPGIECAMAYLLQFQAITAADIWVFTRVVEDAMLFVLVRWREQSKLETCSTIDRLLYKSIYCMNLQIRYGRFKRTRHNLSLGEFSSPLVSYFVSV